MTTSELHEILDNENRKLTLAELKQVIYELKQDAFCEFGKSLETKSLNRQEIRNIGFYDGEQNAFQIVLDLLEHFDESEIRVFKDDFELQPKYKVGDTVYAIGWDYSIQPNPQKKVFEKKIKKVFVGKRKITYFLEKGKGRIEEKFLHADQETAEAILNGNYKV